MTTVDLDDTPTSEQLLEKYNLRGYSEYNFPDYLCDRDEIFDSTYTEIEFSCEKMI